ncbi:MAG: hypothetical protein L0Y76_09230, partial [Ignavibacteria bacterium]|nr:hypothetical protein [Ignavibacteria bacterium]
SPNRCLSDVTYQNYYRLGVITLPYDFSDTPPDIIKTPVQTSSSILVTSGLVKWGGRNELDVQSSFLSNDAGTLPGARIEHHYSIEDPDNPSDTKYNMLLKFDNSEFNTISVIDSAFLEFSPYYLLANLNNESTGDYSFYIKPLTQLDGSQQNMTYTEGSGLLNLGNLPASADASCTKTLDAILEQYMGNFKKIDITQLLNSNITGNALNLQGLKLSMSYTGEYTSGIVDLKMYIYTCSNVSSLYNYWVNNFAPVLKIYARHIDTDTIVKINYNSGTVINTYDDINNKVKTQSKIDKTDSSNHWKTVENYFDKFGKLKSARLYVDETNYNQSEIDYNYLDLKARLSDPLNNRTKISYSKYFNPSKTENPDASYTLVSEAYLNGYTYSF